MDPIEKWGIFQPAMLVYQRVPCHIGGARRRVARDDVFSCGNEEL